MYNEYFGFTALPFQLTPDHRFFYDSSEHRKALAHLTFGLHNPEGFVVITGEVGAGKTTLIEHLLSNLDADEFIVGKIVTTNLDPENLLKMIAYSFGIEDVGDDKYLILRHLEEFMRSAHSQGKTVLLIVDEAQNLPFTAIEELRMLSNLQVGHHAPLQFILMGQPQLRTMLASKDLEQLRQRVIASYHLKPLTVEETEGYIIHRLEMVGWKKRPSFTHDAFKAIYDVTGGVPRRINTLCSRLLLASYLEENDEISEQVVERIAQEQNSELSDDSVQNIKMNAKEKSSPPAKKTTKSMSQSKKLALKVNAIEETIKNFETFLKEHLEPKSS